MRALAALLFAFSFPAQAQTYAPVRPPSVPTGPAAPSPYAPPYPGVPSPGPAQGGYGGCYGCSYVGDYYGSNVPARRPAPPLRLQGQWRNGWWYY
ncbi:hypothetical protein [Methylocystis parvus]|uniref:hypothetical protein n=1 Tax=Methylocystis parvus TaxID=134 RepID=UPI003C736410